MSYAKTILKGSAIIFIMYFIGGAIGYFLRLFLARNLLVEEFGLFYAVLSFAGFLVLFKDLGFSVAMTRFIAHFKAKNDLGSVKSVIYSVILLQLILATLIVIFVFIVSPYLAANYFKSVKAEEPLKIIILSYLVSVFVALQFVFQGFGKIGYYAVVEPLRNLITFSLVVILIPLGVIGIAYSYLLGTIILSIIIFFLVLKTFPFFSVKGRLDLPLTKEIVVFSIPVFFTGLGGTLLGYMDTIFITYFLSAFDVGLYQTALPTSQLLWILLGSASIVLLPIVTELWTRKDSVMITEIISLLIKFSFIVAIPFVITMAAFPEIIIRLLFGEKYIGASLALQILAINSLFYSIFSITSTSILGVGEPKINMKIVTAIGIANLLFNILMVPVFGIAGAALATLISYLMGSIISVIYLRKRKLVNIYLHDMVKAFSGGTLAFIVIILIKSSLSLNPWIEAFIAVTLGSLIYVIFLYLTGTIRKNELMILEKAGIPLPKFLLDLFR